MNYRLVVLTHGDAAPLADTLRSFREHVSPPPSSIAVRFDRPAAGVLDANGWTINGFDPDVTGCGCYVDWTAAPGFCASTRRAWEIAVSAAGIPDSRTFRDLARYDYVFWLEHDFRFRCPVDLRELAAVLDSDPKLAQMALMRNPVNERERAAGGLVASRPGEYRKVWQSELREAEGYAPGEGPVVQRALGPWLEHRSYFTTTPSLMRRDFMADNPWPDYPAECEGRFGIDLVERGYSFGVWGSGEPWVEHVGERTGFGY